MIVLVLVIINIDLHPSCGGDNYIDFNSLRFQIPLGALLPQRVNNLFPACKNIGTTHITNGCYRTHPVEWGIGEAVGLLITYASKKQISARIIRSDKEYANGFPAMDSKRRSRDCMEKRTCVNIVCW